VVHASDECGEDGDGGVDREYGVAPSIFTPIVDTKERCPVVGHADQDRQQRQQIEGMELPDLGTTDLKLPNTST
jgi:hypothetical protein